MLLLLRPGIMHNFISLLLLLSQGLIDIVGVKLVLCTSFIMLLLGLLQDLVEFESLLIEQVVDGLF